MLRSLLIAGIAVVAPLAAGAQTARPTVAADGDLLAPLVPPKSNDDDRLALLVPPKSTDDDLLAPLVPPKKAVLDCRQVMDETNVFTTDDGIELAPLVTVVGRGKKVRPPADDSDLLAPLVKPSDADRAMCKERLDVEIARRIARKIKKRKGTPMQVVGVEIRTYDPCFWQSLKNKGKDCESREMVRHEGVIITDRSADGPEPQEPPAPVKRPPVQVGGRPSGLPPVGPSKPGGAPGQVAGPPPSAPAPAGPGKPPSRPGAPSRGAGHGAVIVAQPALAPEPVW